MVAGWDDEGEIDLLDWFAELTIYTSSACLIGKRFRNELDKRFAELYHDLEQGTDAIAYVDPYAPIESFRRRDAARVGLVAAGRRGSWSGAPPGRRRPTDEDRDLLDVLMSISERGRHDRVSGRRGHRHVHLDDVRRAPHHVGHRGMDAHRAAPPPRRARRGATPSSPSSTPTAPRSATRPCGRCPTSSRPSRRRCACTRRSSCCCGWPRRTSRSRGSPSPPARWSGPARRCPTGSPRTSPTPTRSVPDRYLEPREEDRPNPWTWIPFGAGRHRCVGAAFAMMQLKAIFSRAAAATGSSSWPSRPTRYRNDHSKMVVQLQQPCVVRYRRRAVARSRAGRRGD